MTLRTLAGVLALACVTFSLPVNAQGYDVHGYSGQAAVIGSGASAGSNKLSQGHRASSRHYRHARGSQVAVGDPRPRAWCGWQMRQWFHVADRAFNVARRWATWGSAARGPAPGVIAVFARGRGGHVGIVTSVPGPGRIVLKSGNDGHAVRERERSTRGIIAYRWPPGRVWAAM